MMILSFVLCSLILGETLAFEFNASSPLPPFVLSRHANLSKPRLVIPHVTDYEGYFSLTIPLGMQMAIEGLSKVTPYLDKFELQVDMYDSFCSDPEIVTETLNILERQTSGDNLPVLIGSGCAAIGQELAGEIVHHYNYTTFAIMDSVTESFYDRSRFRSFYTIGESLDTMHSALISFMKEQGWKRVAVLGEEHSFYVAVSLHNISCI